MITKPRKRRLNPMLLNVLLISGGVHVAAILILGGITVYKYIIPEEAQFEEPPQVEAVEPPKEVKVEIRPQAATQPQAMQSLRIKQVGNIAVTNIAVDLPTMEQSFTVSAGVGGFGGGSLLGGTRGSIGMGMSDISVFGLKTRAERILFAIDGSKTMLMNPHPRCHPGGYAAEKQIPISSPRCPRGRGDDQCERIEHDRARAAPLPRLPACTGQRSDRWALRCRRYTVARLLEAHLRRQRLEG